MAWTSFDETPKGFDFSPQKDKCKIHPTQKSIPLYRWILNNYAQKNDKILDTHLGSGSIAIACHELEFELTGCELDREYYDAAYDRFKKETQQLNIFHQTTTNDRNTKRNVAEQLAFKL